jgi:hypothetical protein
MVSTFPQFLQSLAGTVGKYSAENDRRMDREMFSKMMAVNPEFAMQYQSGLAGLENREVQNQERQRQLMEQERVRAALSELGRTPDINPQAALARLSEVTGDPSYLGGFYKSQVGMGASSAGERAIAEVMRENPNMSYTEALEYVKSARLRGELGVSDDVAAAKGKEAYEKKIKELEARLKLESDVEAKNVTAKKDAEYMAEGRQRLPQVQRLLASVEDKKGFIFNKIDEVDQMARQPFMTGFAGSLAAAVPGTPQYDLKMQIDTLIANAGFEALQEMRDNSPTGGALGQVTERELEFLQRASQTLVQSQSQEQLLKNLKTFKDQQMKSMERIKKAYDEDYQRFGGRSDVFLPAPSQQSTARRRYNPATGRIE